METQMLRYPVSINLVRLIIFLRRINIQKEFLMCFFYTFMATWRLLWIGLFFNIYNATCSHPRVNVCEFWGYGWPGWDNTIGTEEGSGGNVAANIEKRYPGIKFDVYITEPDRGHPLPELRLRSAPINCILVHETYCDDNGFAGCVGKDMIKYSNVIFFAYANSMSGLHHHLSNQDKFGAEYSDKLFVHYPHSPIKNIYYGDVDAEREISILLIGKINGLYPIRQKIAKMIEENKIPGAKIRTHPGYHNLGTPENDQGLTFQGANIWQEQQYAKDLANSKIVFVSQSIRNYSLRKYQEVAMAGALMVGDIPPERQNEYRQSIVEIRVQDSEQSIVDKMKWWLTNDKERKQRARIGQKYALSKLSAEAHASALVASWDNYLDGVRGAWYPFDSGISGYL
eukprot:TRINITY_DN1899_c0_g1_i1.p1 TRINITY_DN1899_c0_g1~~TRINITY_DN1899_c0_g1_i1.p1  ORF type:complete len:398 (-),score=56.90 TRINITY_DN1899_c0_g1_i1:584-1777(-)